MSALLWVESAGPHLCGLRGRHRPVSLEAVFLVPQVFCCVRPFLGVPAWPFCSGHIPKQVGVVPAGLQVPFSLSGHLPFSPTSGEA